MQHIVRQEAGPEFDEFGYRLSAIAEVTGPLVGTATGLRLPKTVAIHLMTVDDWKEAHEKRSLQRLHDEAAQLGIGLGGRLKARSKRKFVLFMRSSGAKHEGIGDIAESDQPFDAFRDQGMHRLRTVRHVSGVQADGQGLPGGEGTTTALLPTRRQVTDMLDTPTTRPVDETATTAKAPQDGVVLVDNVEELTVPDQPGCGDDNPYN